MIRKFILPFVLSLPFLLAPDASLAKYKVAPVSGGGTITGKVSFEGKIPAPVKYIITKDHDACGKGQVTRQEVDAKDGALRGVVVYLDKVKKGKAYPKAIQSVVVDQKKCAYVPYLQAVAEGGKVTILNSDAAHHNIHTYEIIGRAKRSMWNISQPRQRKKVVRRAKVRRSPIVRIECDVHNWMKGFLFVARNPYYALVGADGSFEITDVPPGKYSLRAWHPALGVKKKRIAISAGGKKAAAFTFSSK